MSQERKQLRERLVLDKNAFRRNPFFEEQLTHDFWNWPHILVTRQACCYMLLSRHRWSTTFRIGEQHFNAASIFSIVIAFGKRRRSRIKCLAQECCLLFSHEKHERRLLKMAACRRSETAMLQLYQASSLHMLIEKIDIQKLNWFARECLPQWLFFQEEHELRLRHGIVSSRQAHECWFYVKYL